MKNRDWVIHQLQEGKEQLDEIMVKIQTDPDYDSSDLYLDMQHMYRHLNTAWNSRDEDPNRDLNDEDFDKHSRFPEKFDM